MHIIRVYQCLFLVISSVLSVAVNSSEQVTSKLITDASRNLTVHLENIKGRTKVTNIATGELVAWLEGEQAAYWTNEQYKLLLDQEEMQKKLRALTEQSLTATPTNKLKTAILTDTNSGLSVQLENINGHTKVTPLTSQAEAFYIDGELAGLLTDQDYEKMLDIEATEKKLRSQLASEKLSHPNNTYSGSFNANPVYTTPSSFKVASKDLVAHLSELKLGKDAEMTLTLCRDLPAWPDSCYAEQEKSLSPTKANKFSATWLDAFPAGHYYLVISKTNNGDHAQGNYRF